MESEKVKEIKKALECCTIKGKKCEDCQFVDKHPFSCVKKLLCQSLTLINEFESENEKLKTSEFNSCQELDNACTQIHSLEKQIAELGKENAKLLDSVETVQNNRCTTKCELTEKQLKQFAERLKEEICGMKQFFRSCLDRDYCGLSEDQIDERLKEFLK